MNLIDIDFGSSYLHLLVNCANQTNQDKLVPMVYQLSNAGVDVNGRDYKGRTALELAIMRELRDLMAALLRVGVDPTEHDYKAKIREFGSPFEYELINTLEKYEPGLWGAVMKNDAGMVHMLVNSWCRVNVRKGNETLIQFAKNSGKSDEIVNILDYCEVTIEFVHATLAGDEKRMLEFLMDSKPCDPYIMDISYQERWSKPLTPRSLRQTAIAMGHQHVLQLLPEDDDDLESGQGPGHHNKACSATVIGTTSLLDENYVPSDKVSRTNSSVWDSDTDSLQFGKLWNYKNGKRQNFRKKTHSSVPKYAKSVENKDRVPGEKSEQNANQKDDGVVKLTSIEEKCFLFHEVDNFVTQVDPSVPTKTKKPSGSVRGKSMDETTTNRDYSQNWQKMTINQSKTKAKSKLCAIS